VGDPVLGEPTQAPTHSHGGLPGALLAIAQRLHRSAHLPQQLRAVAPIGDVPASRVTAVSDMMIEHSLLVDRAAATRPDEDSIRDWGAEQRVFVSSVMDGYADYRQAAVAAIEAVGAEPVWFEHFGGRDSDPNEAYLGEVRSSTVYLGLLGARYGRPLADRYSATHQEFLEAERSGLRSTVWAQEEVEREGPQQSFFEEVRAFAVTGSYGSPDELRHGVEQRLRALAAEDLSPWVKLGGLVFRASEIQERSGTVVIRAVVRDPDVAGSLRAYEDRFKRRATLLSFADRTVAAEVQSVSTTTRAARAVQFELELKVSAPPQPTRISFNGTSWDELTKVAIAVSLFGEPNPLGVMEHMVQMPSPFPALRQAGVSEESLRPIARLMVSEILVVERGIERLLHFQLGRPIAGQRRLRIGYQVPAQYSNQAAPGPFEVDGEVAA
jgi:Domain of unknown function (DUF4062)